jgi:hypothetical protein
MTAEDVNAASTVMMTIVSETETELIELIPLDVTLQSPASL